MLNSKIGMTHGALVVGPAASLLSGLPAAQQASGWSVPNRIWGRWLNPSVSWDVHPALSPDSPHLYFSSDRPGGTGGCISGCATCESLVSLAAAGAHHTVEQRHAAEFGPAFDPSGRWLFFGSERDGGCGGAIPGLSYGVNPKDDLAWKPPVNLGLGD